MMNRSKILSYSLMTLLFGLLCLPVSAQSCLGYEKEMEEYFLNFQSGNQVNIRRVESVFSRCPRPTDKMSLIYYYFKSLEAWTAEYLSDEAAYHDARFFYEKAALHFPYFLDSPEKDEFFVNMYFDRAIALETQLGIESISYNVPPEALNDPLTRGADNARYQSRYAGNVQWEKYTPFRNDVSSSTYRSADPYPDASSANFRKSQYRSGSYQEETDDAELIELNGETFGNVGNLNSLHPVEYLRYQREWENATSRSLAISGGGTATQRTRGELEQDYDQNQGANLRTAAPRTIAPDSYAGLVSIYDDVVVRRQPGESAQPVGLVRFGESVARLDQISPVQSGKRKYVSVRLAGGQLGWIPTDVIVPEGKLAVITNHTKGYVSLNPEAARDRGMILFRAAELVVLEAIQGDYILVTSRNAEKSAWVRGIGGLSIDPIDIQIGAKIHEAFSQNNITVRKAQLQRIRFIPGFEQSQLTMVVQELLAESYSMN
jgi:hypothetical protein